MLLLLLPLVALAAAVAYGAGGRRVALGVGTAGVVLLVAGTVAVGTAEVRSDGQDDGAAPVDEAADPSDQEDGPPTAPPLRRPDLVLGPPRDPFDGPDPVGRLADGEVRLVEVHIGADDRDDRRVSLHQCLAGALTAERCTEGVDAVASAEASPTVLVELDRRISTASGSVDCAEKACVLAVFDGATPLFDVPLAFEDTDALTRPQVTVTPASSLRPGEEVSVSVTGLPARATGTVAFCAAADDATRPRCEEAGAVPLTAGTDGRATTDLRLGRCPRIEQCALRIAAGPSPLTYAELAFASPPGPDLDRRRVGAGLAAAAGLVLGAIVLVRRCDWSPPGGDPFLGIDLAHHDPFAGIDLSAEPDDR